MKKSIIFAALLFGLYSCQEDLDIKPEDRTSREEAFQTGLGVRSFVTGLYGLAQQEGALNGVPQLLGDWQSDDITFRGSFPTLRDVRDYVTISDNGNVLSIWQDHYEIITQANYIVNKIDTCLDPDFDQTGRDQAVGEAKFMRALMYLQLVNLFSQPIQTVGASAPGVPLVLITRPDTEIGVGATPRATIGEVYAQIENDLLDAIVKLSNVEIEIKRTRANVGAAKALLARVYLYQDKFIEATDYANQVIGMSVNFKLASNYLFYDSPGDEEHVFTLVNSPDDAQSNSVPDGGAAVGYSNLTNASQDGGRGDCPFSADLKTVFSAEAGDLRYELKRPDPQSATRFFTTKYQDGINFASDAAVIRITEMYLIRAEGNFRAATAVGDTSLNDINKLRQRAGLVDLATVDLTGILLERRKEMCFEGHRRMDLLRNGLQLRRVGLPQASLSAPGMPKVVMPIPQREIDLSKGHVLIQNAGY